MAAELFDQLLAPDGVVAPFDLRLATGTPCGACSSTQKPKDAANGSVGYVTRFDVDARYVRRFEPHSAGGHDLVELWVPAEEIDDFNDHIVGRPDQGERLAPVPEAP